MGAGRRHQPLAALTPRESQVLALMAEGRTNRAISQLLFMSEQAVEPDGDLLQAPTAHDSDQDHRRVLAVVAYLPAAMTGAASGSWAREIAAAAIQPATTGPRSHVGREIESMTPKCTGGGSPYIRDHPGIYPSLSRGWHLRECRNSGAA